VLRRGRKAAESEKSETDLEEVVSWITGAKPGPQMDAPDYITPRRGDQHQER
jgi:hypothetical protein